jgi:hypothetical protein
VNAASAVNAVNDPTELNNLQSGYPPSVVTVPGAPARSRRSRSLYSAFARWRGSEKMIFLDEFVQDALSHSV